MFPVNILLTGVLDNVIESLIKLESSLYLTHKSLLLKDKKV